MPIKPTEESTLRKILKDDGLSKALRDRAAEAGYDVSEGCEGCNAKLTEADIDAGECQMCGTLLPELEDRN